MYSFHMLHCATAQSWIDRCRRSLRYVEVAPLARKATIADRIGSDPGNSLLCEADELLIVFGDCRAQAKSLGL